MPRTARLAPGAVVFCVLNLGGGKGCGCFFEDGDFEAFERGIGESLGADYS